MGERKGGDIESEWSRAAEVDSEGRMTEERMDRTAAAQNRYG